MNRKKIKFRELQKGIRMGTPSLKVKLANEDRT